MLFFWLIALEITIAGLVYGEVVLTPLSPSETENNSLTLTCTYFGDETVSTLTWKVVKKNESTFSILGMITSECNPFLIPVDTNLYEYACLSNKQYTWTIKKVTVQNIGEIYQCAVDTPSPGVMNSNDVTLSVQVPISFIQLITPSSSIVTVIENNETLFKCKTSGAFPKAIVGWFKSEESGNEDENELQLLPSPSGSKITTSSITVNGLEEVTSTLTYSPPRSENGWRIYCKGFNHFLPVISKRKPQLNVQYPPSLPTIEGFINGGEYRVIENTPGNFTCSIFGGNPAPTLSWDCYNSGTSVSASAGTVTKVHTWKAKRGEDKTCTCSSSHYSGTKSVTINVVILYPPTLQGLIKKDIIAGFLLNLSCPFEEGNPQLTMFKWTRNGDNREWNEQILYIENVTKHDDMMYTCTVKNVMKPTGEPQVIGQDSDSFHLNVLYPPDLPIIEGFINGGDYRVIENIPGNLTCSIFGGNPAPTLSLDCYNSGTSVSASAGTVTKVHTWIAKRGEDKTCTCSSSHYSGTKFVTINVVILYPPTRPTFTIRQIPVSDTVTVIRNDSLSIRCSSSANPSPSYTWTYFNNPDIFSQVLTIDNAQIGKRLTCNVQNTMNPTGDANITRSTSSYIDFQVIYPPKLKGLIKKDIVAGSRLNLSCPLEEGNQQLATFKWTRTDDNREWNDQILYIENVTKYDDMMYTCTAKIVMKPTGAPQVIEQDSDSFHLNVLYQSTILSFVVDGNVNTSSVTVTENHPVQFGCIIDSNPNSSVEVTFEDKIIYRQNHSNTVLYNYKAATCQDAGIYSCIARNRYNYGKDSTAKLKLYVRCSPRPLNQLKVNYTSKLNDTVTLNLTTLAYPEPGTDGFAWYKRNSFTWVPLFSNTDLLITSSGLQTGLTIKRVSTADFGLYRVTVTNNVGKYDQYLYLTEERQQTDTNTHNESSSVILVIVLSSLLAAVALFAVVITICLQRRLKKTGKKSTAADKSTKTATYANVSYQPGEAGETRTGPSEAETGASSQETVDPIHQYTDLAHYSNDDQTTTYDVLQNV